MQVMCILSAVAYCQSYAFYHLTKVELYDTIYKEIVSLHGAVKASTGIPMLDKRVVRAKSL